MILFWERRMRCAKAMVVGSIIWLAAPPLRAAAPNGQYTDLKNGTVRDNKTGLVWQQEPSGTRMTWDVAKTYCSQLDLGGFSSGWRLPEKLELESIVDVSVASPGPTIDTAVFPSTPQEGFWTMTPYAGSGDVWLVYFTSGNSFIDMAHTNWVRCVR